MSCEARHVRASLPLVAAALAVLLGAARPCEGYSFWMTTNDLLCRPRYPSRTVPATPVADSDACEKLCKEYTGTEPCAAALFQNNECTLHPGGCLSPPVFPDDYQPGVVLLRAVCENAKSNDMPYKSVSGRSSDCDCEESCEHESRCRFWQREVATDACSLFDVDSLGAVRTSSPGQLRYGMKACYSSAGMCPIPPPLAPTPAPPTQAPPTPAAPPTPGGATPSPPTRVPKTAPPGTPAPPTEAPIVTPAGPTSLPLTLSPVTPVPTAPPVVPTPAPDAGGGTTAVPEPSSPDNQPSSGGEGSSHLHGSDLLHELQASQPLGQAAAAMTLMSSSPDSVRVLLADEECNAGQDGTERQLGWMVHPTQLVVGGSPAVGVVIGNTMVVCALVCLNALAAVIFGTVGHLIASQWVPADIDKWGAVRFPGLPLVAMLYLHAGTSLGASMLLFSHSAWHQAVGACTFLLLLGLPAVWVWHVRRSLHLHAVHLPDNGRNTALKQCLLGPGEWCSLHVHPSWVERYFVVRHYRDGAAWFLAVDCISTMLVCGAQGADPGTWDGCGHVKLATAAVFLVHGVAQVALTPCARLRDNITQTCILLMQFFATLLMAVGYYKRHLDHWAFTVSGWIVFGVFILIFVRTLLHAGCETYVFFKSTRKRLERQALDMPRADTRDVELKQHLRDIVEEDEEEEEEEGEEEGDGNTQDELGEEDVAAAVGGRETPAMIESDFETDLPELLKTTSSLTGFIDVGEPTVNLRATWSGVPSSKHRRRTPSPLPLAQPGLRAADRSHETMRPPRRSTSRASSGNPPLRKRADSMRSDLSRNNTLVAATRHHGTPRADG